MNEINVFEYVYLIFLYIFLFLAKIIWYSEKQKVNLQHKCNKAKT